MNYDLTPEDFRFPSVGGLGPTSPAFNHDGSLIAYLYPGATHGFLDLRVYDRKQGRYQTLLMADEVVERQRHASEDEELARERLRQPFLGFSNFSWLPRSDALLAIASNLLFFVDAKSGVTSRYEFPTFIESARVSHSGRELIFCSANDLWRLKIPNIGKPLEDALQVTNDGSCSLLNGVPDQITREEIYNGTPYSWCYDDTKLIYASFDTSEIEVLTITNGAQTRVESISYARPGNPVATFSLWVLDLCTGNRIELLPRSEQWPYFAGLSTGNGNDLVLMRLRRDQAALQLLTVVGGAGQVTKLLELSNKPWINLLGGPLFCKGTGGFFLVHERENIGRIGLFDSSGEWVQDIESDCGHVESIIGPDAESDGVFFLATGDDPRERHIYHASPHSKWTAAKVTTASGTHSVVLAPGAKVWLHRHDAVGQPPSFRLECPTGGVSECILESISLSDSQRCFIPPQLIEAYAADGTTRLYAAIYTAKVRSPSQKSPVVLLVYGGPHAQSVRNTWTLTTDMRAQLLVQRGFTVVKVDNRGTSGRGLGFEAPLYGNLGTIEVEDQCAVLEQILDRRRDLDSTRVAICGWSYGGYMVLRCIQLRPDLFKAGVAGAPVVRWEDYDAPYTERYMGTPKQLAPFPMVNEHGYCESSALRRIEAATCPLLLIHGMNDENVLFRHSAMLIDKLAATQHYFELLLLPNERHGVRGQDQRVYVEARVLEFIERSLL